MILFKSKSAANPLLEVSSEIAAASSISACRSVFERPGTAWLAPVQLSAQTVANVAQQSNSARAVLSILDRLDTDDYLEYLRDYYQQGLENFGDVWNYADLLTFLYASAQLLRPRNYLEIGVRRGRSMAVIAATSPGCSMVGFDLWVQNYAGMANPGPDFVRQEMEKFHHRGPIEFISGDSHETVPDFFSQHPELGFDLINVDGDHSNAGARLDLACVLPHLNLGGVLLLDDIVHPQHRYLETVWDDLIGSNENYHTFKYRDLGYGVAIAIRRN